MMYCELAKSQSPGQNAVEKSALRPHSEATSPPLYRFGEILRESTKGLAGAEAICCVSLQSVTRLRLTWNTSDQAQVENLRTVEALSVRYEMER